VSEPTDRSPYLAQHIRDSLAAGSTAELGVDVNVTPSGVFLTGTVTSEEQRAQLAEIAARESGGLEVHNEVVVAHGDPDVEVEVLG
jgi:osmotically-inducible protein OsmY